MLSQTEENYLKCIYKLSLDGDKGVSTNSISAAINTTAASVTDMLKKLAEKGLLDYIKYRGVKLTDEGLGQAVALIRKHRLWESFLADTLKMGWDEVHDIAEQLEHIKSARLIQRLDEFLGFPKFDPHGDPIPDQYGHYTERPQILLSQLIVGESGVIVGVKDHTKEFLQYLAGRKLILGSVITIVSINSNDRSIEVDLPLVGTFSVPTKVSENVYISKGK